MQALEELVLHWASGGLALGGDALAADRRAAQGAAREARRLDAAAGARDDARGGEPGPDHRDAVGHHARAPAGVGARAGRRAASSCAARPAAPGVVEGPARVVKSVDQIGEVRDGEILVCGSTSPAWAPIFSRISATVTDIGGVMSHAAIVCREYGLPAVVGTGRATAQIRTGQRIRVDGTAGTVTVARRGRGRRVTDAGHTRPLADLRAADEAALRRQEHEPRRAAWPPGSRCRPGFAIVDERVPRVPRRRAGSRRGSPRRSAAVTPGRRGARCRPRPTRSAPRCARPTVPDGRARADRRGATPTLGDAGRSRCARARSARTAARRRSPASRRRTSGSAAPTACATRCATAGRARSARRR